jgi:hypothetical protein
MRQRDVLVVAAQAWINDGKPEYDPSEPGSVGKNHYVSWANLILQAADDAGLVLISKRDVDELKRATDILHREAKLLASAVLR